MLFWLLLFIFIAAVAVAGGWLVRSYLAGGGMPSLPFFSPKPEKRLAIMEQAALDGRRRLVLIRRDDVEHLIMTGGPVDVVIETGIGPPAHVPALPETRERSDPVFTRQPRPLGQAVNE
ncbi:MAG: hypothetical protein AB7K67_01205 [Hyphomicrobiaceae bacterium]